MKLYERAALIADEDHLTFHLSEPNFTLWQRLWRRIKLSVSLILDWIH
jgi:hypothetical protein